MRTTVVLLAVCCCLSAVSGQWLENEIQLPDSLCGIRYSALLVCDTADDRVLVAGKTDDWLIVIDAVTSAKIARIPVPSGLRDMLYVPELGRVYCASRARRVIYAVDPDAGVVVDSTRPLHFVDSLAYSVSANKLYCTYGSEKAIRVVDCALDSFVNYIGLQALPGQMLWVPSVNKLYCTMPDSGLVAAIDCTNDSLLCYIAVGPDPRRLLYNPQSERLYCSVRSIDSVAIIDPVTDQVIRRVTAGPRPIALGFNPILNQVYCAPNHNNVVTIICGRGDTVVGAVPLSSGVLSFTYDVDDSLCFAYDMDDWLRVLDCRNNEYVDSLYIGPQSDIGYDPRTDRMYGTRNNRASVFDVAAGTLLDQIVLGTAPLDVRWCPEGNKLYCAGANETATAVVDCLTNTVTGFIPTPHATGMLLYNPRRNKMYAAGGGRLSVIDCYRDSIVAGVNVGSSILDLCYNSSYDELYTASTNYANENVVQVTDCATDSVVARVDTRLYPFKLAWSSKSNAVYCACYPVGYVQAIDCETRQIIADIPTPGRPIALEYWPEGDLVFVGLKDSGKVLAIDCKTNEVIAHIPIGSGVSSFALAGRRRELYCTNSAHYVTVVSCSTLTAVARIDVSYPPTTLTYDSIADKVYCVSESQGIVSVVDCRERSLVATVPVGDGARFAAWSPVSRKFYTSNYWSSNLSVIRDTAVAGMAGHGASVLSRREPNVTILRGVLWQGDRGQKTEDRAELVDISGRKVLDLHPGANDVRALAPGVYFMREAHAQAHAQAIRKVVVTK